MAAFPEQFVRRTAMAKQEPDKDSTEKKQTRKDRKPGGEPRRSPERRPHQENGPNRDRKQPDNQREREGER